MNRLKTFLILIILGLPQLVAASDLAKEKRWADQIVEFLVDGDAVWLDAGGQKFLSIYTEATTDPVRGGVILVHGSGAHPNWQDVIHPLRTQLPERGWSTLSIQMPVLANDAEYQEYAPLFDEVAPRLDAAVDYLKQQGIDHILLVSHSLGSAMSAYYLSSGKRPDISGFVAIGLPGPQQDKRMNTLVALKKISIPLLDLYGSKDLETVLGSAKDRKAAAAQNSNYSQQVVDGANHFFVDKNTELVNSVSDWIAKH